MLLTNIDSPAALMNIALQAEREAIRRYTKLAASMRDTKNSAAEHLFVRLISEEQEHEKLLLKWMASEGIKELEDSPVVTWFDPQVSTTYNEEACNSYHSTPYRALAFAVHNEEMAFNFYTHVAAHSQNKIVRQHAEVLAREELGHAALLRAERRKAFHEEQNNHTQEPRLDASIINSKVDLLAAAIHIDRYLIDQMQTIKKSNPEIMSLLLESTEQLAENELSLEDEKTHHQFMPSEEVADNLEKLKQHNLFMQQKFDQPNQEASRLWACCDRSFAFYDAIVATTDNENIMLLAQRLTSSSLDRIKALKTLLKNSYA